jgi:parvulin-like peptidyl-prolyl isomerase
MLTYLRKRMKNIMLVIAIVFAASMFYGIGASRFSGGEKRIKGLATVNGREIDAYQYREFLNRLARQTGKATSAQQFAFIESQALQQTIDFMIILKEAKRKVKISRRELSMAVENVMKQGKFKSKKEFEVAIKRMGLTPSKFNEMMKNEMLVSKMIKKIRSEIKITPNDLREVSASHILLTSEAVANAVLADIKKGESFSTLAKKYSKDPGSAKKGGDLGYFSSGMMVESFDKAVFALKVGEVSDIVKSPFGYHIIKLHSTRLRKFEGKEKNIEKAALADKQNKVYQKWYSDLRKDAKIEITHPGLKGHVYRFRGQILEAIEEYKKAIALSPGNAYLHVFLGDSYYAIGKKEQAITEYQAAVRVQSGKPEFYMILAMAYEKTGKNDLAIKEYRKISMLAGDNKEMHENMIEIYKKIGAWKEIAHERAEIKRIEKKEKFEKSLQDAIK